MMFKAIENGLFSPPLPYLTPPFGENSYSFPQFLGR